MARLDHPAICRALDRTANRHYVYAERGSKGSGAFALAVPPPKFAHSMCRQLRVPDSSLCCAVGEIVLSGAKAQVIRSNAQRRITGMHDAESIWHRSSVRDNPSHAVRVRRFVPVLHGSVRPLRWTRPQPAALRALNIPAQPVADIPLNPALVGAERVARVPTARRLTVNTSCSSGRHASENNGATA